MPIKTLRKISNKHITSILWVGFTSIITLALLAAYISLNEAKNVINQLNSVIKTNNQKIDLAYEMRDSIRQRQNSINWMRATDDILDRDDELQRFYTYAGIYRETRNKLFELSKGFPKEIELHNKLTEATRVSQPLNKQAAELLLDEEASEEETTEVTQQADLYQQNLIKLLNELIVLQQNRSDEVLKKITASYLQIQNITLFINGIMLVIGILISILVTRFVAFSNKKLEIAVDEAKQAANSKSEFLANMSHEIRTPMNGILGMLDLLRSSELNHVQQEQIEVANNSANTLLTIINDILDVSKIESGKLYFENIEYDLYKLIDEVVDLFQEDSLKKSVDLYADIDPDLPVNIKGDPTRIRQILNNLISNAIKFTNEGEVKIVLTILHISLHKIHIKVEVIDTGIGISKEKQVLIFEPFSQADGSTTREFGGTGLGLAICKKLVELAGGSIGVESTQDEGSTFWFTINAQLTSEQQIFESDEQLNNTQGILYLPTTNKLAAIKRMVSPWGLTLETYDKLDSFLKILSSNKAYDFILFDERVIEHVKAIKNLKPKVMLCISKNKKKTAADESSGNDAFCKIIDSSIKRITLHNILSQQNKDDKKAVYPVFNFDQELEILIVDDVEVNLLVAQSYLKKLNLKSDKAYNGEEALEKIKHKHYHLILMDCQMPIMNGYDASSAIRRYEKESNKTASVIIAMTANVLKADRDRCFESGMDDFLAKPIRIEMLIEKIQKWM